MRDTPEFRRLQVVFGQRLREKREELALTQEEAAARTGFGWRHLQKIEAGEVNLTLLSLHRFAVAYGFDVLQLFAKPG